jgi:hypothetical protein
MPVREHPSGGGLRCGRPRRSSEARRAADEDGPPSLVFAELWRDIRIRFGDESSSAD